MNRIEHHAIAAVDRMIARRNYRDRARLLHLITSLQFMEPPPPPPSRPLPEFTLDEPIGTCGICMEEMKEGEKIRWLPCQETINHAFHVACIDPWLKSHSSCPTCRGECLRFQKTMKRPQSLFLRPLI